MSEVTPNTPKEIPPGYTPAMRRFLEIKNEHPNLLILYRMGDFYETFFEDAEKVHRILGLTLTSRSGSADPQKRIPMAGIPFTTLDQYLVRLVDQGLSVGIVEQFGTPGKTVMERRLTKIITPGTLTEEGLLGERKDSILLALCPGKKTGRIGLSWMAISSGLFRCTEIAADALINELARLNPSEILIPDSFRSEAERLISSGTVTPLPDWNFDLVRSEKTLCAQFQTSSLQAFGLEGQSLMILAAGVVLEYAKETQCTELEHITSITVEDTSETLGIDVASRRNLEISQSLRGDQHNTLLSVLDHCSTAMGSRKLRSWLSSPLRNPAAAEERLETVESLMSDIFRMDNLRDLLKNLPDFERTATRIALRTARPRELAALRDALPQLTQISEICQTLNTQLGNEIASAAPIPEALYELLHSALLEEPNSHLRDGDVIANGYNAELDELRDLRDHSGAQLIELENREKERTGITTLRIEYNSVSGYFIEVSKGQVDKVPADYRRRQTLKNVERFITPELKAFEDKAISATERSKALEKKLYEDLVEQCAPFCSALLQSASAVSTIDVLNTFAKHADLNRWVKPKFAENPGLKIKAARHPVVEKSLENFVPNDCDLHTARRLLIITGPNMGGKSTYMRSIALIVLLAYCGSYVPAESAVIGPVDRILTRIGASDDLARGMSTFMVEMTEAASILRQATASSLVLMDEIGRGTSTFDGLSLAASIAEELVSCKQCMTLFATHYFEITQLEKMIPGVANVHVAAVESNRNIVFLHEIKEGAASQSYGIGVAKLAGVPNSVIRRARKILNKLEERAAQASDRQLDLFTEMPMSSAPEDEEPEIHNVLKDKLMEINPDDISPRQAWEILTELKSLAEDV